MTYILAASAIVFLGYLMARNYVKDRQDMDSWRC